MKNLTKNEKFVH